MRYIVRHLQDTHAVPQVLPHGEISLGRAPDNQMQIEHITVSSHHARIYSYFNSSYIEDLNSTNGTYVNGKRVHKHLLKPGDVVSLGAYQLNIESHFAVASGN